MKLMKRVLSVVVVLSMAAVLFAGCSGGEQSGISKTSNEGNKEQSAQFSDPVKGQQIATIKVKDFGEIKAMMFPKAAPKGVENFVKHAQDGYYDGVTFHRVIEEFMIQGGDPKGDGTGGESIWGEGFGVEYDGTLRNYSGALAYANSGPDSNGSQFFIVNAPAVEDDSYFVQVEEYQKAQGIAVDFPDEVQENYKEAGGYPTLDGSYTVFGQVIEGMDVVEKIMQVEKDWNDNPFMPEQSIPVEKVIIETITISEYEG